MKAIFFNYIFFINLTLYSQDTHRYLDSLELEIKKNHDSKDDVKAKLLLRTEAIFRYCKPEKYGMYLDSIEKIVCAPKFDNQAVKADFLLLKGGLERRDGKFDNSFESILSAKRIAEAINDTMLLIRVHLGLSSLNNRISSSNSKGLIKSALYHSDLAYKLANSYKSPYGLSISSQMHAANLMIEHKPKEAKEVLEKNSLSIKKIDDSILRDICISYNDCLLGLCSDDLKVAEQYLKKSLLRSESAGHKYIASLVCHNLAYKIYQPKKHYAQALYFLGKGLKITDVPKEKLSTYRSITDIFDTMGNHDKAYQYLMRYVELKDSLDKFVTDNEFAQLQTKYETTIKEAKIKQLELEAKIKQKDKNNLLILLLCGFVILLILIFLMIKINFEKDKAEAAVKSRDLIFSIISHDIRSPLIGLNYAIPAIKIAINNDNKEKKAQLLSFFENKIQDLYFLTENIFYWSQLNRHETIAFTEFNPYKEIQNIIDQFEIKLGQKKMTIEYLANPKGIEFFYDRMILLTVFRNVLDNAIKFGPEGSMIKVDLNMNGQILYIHVKDEGPGVPKERIESLFKFKKIDDVNIGTAKNGSGVGLGICMEMLRTTQDGMYCLGETSGHFVIVIADKRKRFYGNNNKRTNIIG
jgi:signal transduction histidine kinase